MTNSRTPISHLLPRTLLYQFGPFGEVVRATGPARGTNPFRFSTKYQDDETDLLYYGYRYYNASTGRWLSRDPIEEFGGINLYHFCGGNPVQYTDNLGLLGPVAGFAIDCLKEVLGSVAGNWLKNQGDKVAICGMVFGEIQSKESHMGCHGTLTMDSSKFLNDVDDSWKGRVVSCLWGRISGRGISALLKNMPEGVEKDLLDMALGGAAGSLELAMLGDVSRRIKANCTPKGISVSVFTQVNLTFGGQTSALEGNEKSFGICGGPGAGAAYDTACRCCTSSRWHPEHIEQ